MGFADSLIVGAAYVLAGTDACISARQRLQDTGELKELNVYNWSDYIGETTIADFEKETGIKVQYDTYTGNEDLEAKLVTGGTGYDVVLPSSSFFARQIKIGLYQKLDKSMLPNLKNKDPSIMAILSKDADPGNEYAIPYMWGTNGFSYNVDMLKERMPDAPLDSLAIIFDPEIIKKFADCGVTFLGLAGRRLPAGARLYGQGPDIAEGRRHHCQPPTWSMKVRPYIKNFDPASNILPRCPTANIASR